MDMPCGCHESFAAPRLPQVRSWEDLGWGKLTQIAGLGDLGAQPWAEKGHDPTQTEPSCQEAKRWQSCSCRLVPLIHNCCCWADQTH